MYDDAGRMVSATTQSGGASYRHNGLGQRVRKTTGSVSTYFVYDEAGHLVGEYGSAGGLIQETVWLGDIPVATLRPTTGGAAELFYIHTDHLNTLRRISRPSDNAILWRWDADPFGGAAANEDPDEDTVPFVYNLRFPGQYFDAERGLHYNYFRDYDPQTGRYVESDPLGLNAGINTYEYSDSNPILNSDPSGLLVRGSGWSKTQWRDIQDAEARIRKELKKECSSCPKGDKSCVPCSLIPLLLEKLDSVVVTHMVFADPSICGWSPSGIGLSSHAWHCRPGCFTSTLYHELLHTANLIFDDPTRTSPPADYLERKCIGALCGGGAK